MQSQQRELIRQREIIHKEEQQLALTLYYQDLGETHMKEILQVFSNVEQNAKENLQKLQMLESEDGFIYKFQEIVTFVKANGSLNQQKKKIKDHFRIMHLRIVDLYEDFKKFQIIKEQTKVEFEIVYDNLMKKEKLLERVTEPENDFNDIMKSFIDKNQPSQSANMDNFEDRQGYLGIRLQPPKAVKATKIENLFWTNSQTENDKDDQMLKDAKSISKRLLVKV